MSQTILIIDDSASIRQMIGSMLVNAGYAVLEAEDGQKGLDMLQSRTVDLIFTDQNMPNMDGLTFVTTIRKRLGHEKTPILILTTESSDDIKAQGRTAGATGWLVKPLNPVHVMTLVKKILS